jgi:hypothetical protein
MNYRPIIFLGIPLLMYLGQAIFDYWMAGRKGMALCMCAYALANVGLILDAYGI